MTATKIVTVHAWEYVNVSIGFPRRHINAGGGGFDWYPNALDATKAFKEGFHTRAKDDAANTADFLFEYTVHVYTKPEDITDMIDAALVNLTAAAKIRRVGTNVLTYWKRNKFKMGGAKRPARLALSS